MCTLLSRSCSEQRTFPFISGPARGQLPYSILSAMCRVADHEVVEAASSDVSARRESIENARIETEHTRDQGLR